MTTLTADEWNERYPFPAGTFGTPVAYRTTRSDGTKVTYLSHAIRAVSRYGEQLVELAEHGKVPLAAVEPLATDQQRLDAGWLPPEEAEKLRAQLGLRTLGAKALQQMHTELAELRADRDAMLPVVEAARALVAGRRRFAEIHPGWLGWDLSIDRLVAAVDALDTEPLSAETIAAVRYVADTAVLAENVDFDTGQPTPEGDRRG